MLGRCDRASRALGHDAVRRLVDGRVAALVGSADPAGQGDDRQQRQEPGGEALGDRSGAAEVVGRCRVAALQVEDVGGEVVDVAVAEGRRTPGIAPGPMRTASPISRRRGLHQVGRVAAAADGRTEPDATWHAASSAGTAGPPAPGRRAPGRRRGSPARPRTRHVVDEGDDLGLGVTASAPLGLHVRLGSGIRPVRSTKSAAAAPSFVNAGPGPRCPSPSSPWHAAHWRQVEVAAVDGLLLRRRRRAADGPNDSSPTIAAATAGPTRSILTG